MPASPTVLLLGATGRTGQRVLEQLLARNVRVRAIVRSAARLPAGGAGDPRLAVVEAELLSMSDADLLERVRGCDAVVSCLGHVISLKGVFGPPRDLVTCATSRVCRAIRDAKPSAPIRFVLMSSVSVNPPGAREARRSAGEIALLAVLRALVPPARDNQSASDFLHAQVGASDPSVQWVVVRPDTLRRGDGTPYAIHEHLVASLSRPEDSTMANVAHFMCELVTNAGAWQRWAGRMPVIVDETRPPA